LIISIIYQKPARWPLLQIVLSGSTSFKYNDFGVIMLRRIFFISFFAVFVSAEGDSLSRSKVISFKPCAQWIYNFDVNSYGCSWTGSQTSFYSATEVDKIVTGLNKQIETLERRIKSLEEKLD